MTYLADHTYSILLVGLDKRYETCDQIDWTRVALACRGCLATGVRLRCLDSGLSQAFVELSGLPVQQLDRYQLMCSWCLRSLHKLLAFRRRCQSAMNRLQRRQNPSHPSYGRQISTRSLKSIYQPPDYNLTKTKVEIVNLGDDDMDSSENIINVIDTNDEDYYFNGDVDTEIVLNDLVEDFINDVTPKCTTSSFNSKSFKTKFKDPTDLKEVNNDVTAGNNVGIVLKNINSNDYTLSENTELDEICDDILTDAPYSSKVCYENSTQESDLEIHKRFIQTDKLKPYTCSNCNETFSLKKQLESHCSIHTSDKLESFDVSLIKSSQKGPLSHKRKRNTCKVCNETFSLKEDLLKHKKIHKVGKSHSCYICNKTYSVKKLLVRHIRVHTGERPYSCDVCNKTFSCRDSLRAHKKIHVDGKPYKCDVCHKTFKLRSSLKQHKKIHTGIKPYSCNVCHKRFTFGQQLRIHSSIHTGERNYTCNVCNKSFRQWCTLTTHKKYVHSDARQFACDACGKTYKQRHGLAEHKAFSCSAVPNLCETKFCCDACPKAFKRMTYLNEHKKYDCLNSVIGNYTEQVSPIKAFYIPRKL